MEKADASTVLNSEVIDFISLLHKNFNPRRLKLLEHRKKRDQCLIVDDTIKFRPETKHIRSADWLVNETPADLLDRRVEITGPAEPKMMINALNSGAQIFMADMEDSLSPNWENILLAQESLYKAVRHNLTYTSEDKKNYKLNEKLATLVVRPRGLHMIESNFEVENEPISASLFDFGVFFYLNAQEQIRRHTGPYFYLPKIENYLEARWWNEVFVYAQAHVGIPRGTIRATVLIETIVAAFEMDEILFELREHASGLNAGRWDYIFSLIKKFHHSNKYILPDRSDVTMTSPFMAAYAELLVTTCHRRNAHAIGGMAAFVPSRKGPDSAKQATFEKVAQDKAREARIGFDGSWVAHPDLVPIVKTEFDKVLKSKPNQKDVILKRSIDAAELLDTKIPNSKITEAGIRSNISVALQYIELWLAGVGAVAINNLMEDTATAEIARSQLWQWLHHGVTIEGGHLFDRDTYLIWRASEERKLRESIMAPLLERASSTLDELVLSKDFTDFLTTKIYHRLLNGEEIYVNLSLPQSQGADHERHKQHQQLEN